MTDYALWFTLTYQHYFINLVSSIASLVCCCIFKQIIPNQNNNTIVLLFLFVFYAKDRLIDSFLQLDSVPNKRIWPVHKLAVCLGRSTRVPQCEHRGADCADVGCPRGGGRIEGAGCWCDGVDQTRGPSQDVIISWCCEFWVKVGADVNWIGHGSLLSSAGAASLELLACLQVARRQHRFFRSGNRASTCCQTNRVT